MQHKEYFKEVSCNVEQLDTFIRKQQSAPTITLFGPTSSGKSTVITEVLDKKSSRLLAKNIGDTAQTTLIKTTIMLNAQFDKEQVIIQGIKHTNNITVFLNFKRILVDVITDELYRMRDELEDFEITDGMLKKILDADDCSYHIYSFVKEKKLDELLEKIISDISYDIINVPELLNEKADTSFKEQKKINSKIKKRDVYSELVDKRLSNEKNDTLLKNWFEELLTCMENNINDLWKFKINSCCYYVSETAESESLTDLMDKIYEKNSPYSLLFDEIRYITSPSDKLNSYFKKHYTENSTRKLKLNIIDTMGLTQSSQEKQYIDDNINKVLAQKTDALLFLCSADEQTTVFTLCMDALKDNAKKWEYIPLTVCRTKADIVLRNLIVNAWRSDTGENSLPDDGHFKDYADKVFDVFKKDYVRYDIKLSEDKNKIKFDFLSLAPDLSERFNKALENSLSSDKLFRILMNLLEAIDKIYNGNDLSRPWLYSSDVKHTPLMIHVKADRLIHTISEALTSYNSKNNKQYMQYVTSKECFHGRSVNCFRTKLRYGEGHETVANTYGNFKLYIKNMVARWLRELIPVDEIINDVSIDTTYLSVDSRLDINIAEFENKLKINLKMRWWNIIDKVARKLAYDKLAVDFENSYIFRDWNTGFRESLKVINCKFSLSEYWELGLKDILSEEIDLVLQSMYIYD